MFAAEADALTPDEVGVNPNEDTGGALDDGGADVDTTDILDTLVADELPPDFDKETGGNGVTVQLPGPGKHPN